MIDTPILITGSARSGTSLVAGIIQKSGAWGGILSGPTPFNKKGMFENTIIRNNIVKSWLRSNGFDPLGQNPLPPRHLEPNPHWYTLVRDTIEAQGYQGNRWFYKGAKMTLMWQFWHYAFPNADWIIVRRNIDEIAHSCLHTPFMQAYSTHLDWMQWVIEHECRFEIMKEAGLRIREIWSEEIIKGDLIKIKLLIEDLDLKWNEKDVREFIDPAIWCSWNN